MANWKPNRFILFGGPRFYPSGGFKNYLGDYSTVFEAKRSCALWIKEYDNYAWGHIFDLELGKIILEIDYEPEDKLADWKFDALWVEPHDGQILRWDLERE